MAVGDDFDCFGGGSKVSVDFSEVQVGDRVRLTRENGDESTFTVGRTSLAPAPYYITDNAGTDYFDSDWDSLEILEKPLPTKTGTMIHNGSVNSTYFVLDSSGRWRNDAGQEIDAESITHYLADGWKVVFEGLEYDA